MRGTLRRLLGLVVAAALAGCGGDSSNSKTGLGPDPSPDDAPVVEEPSADGWYADFDAALEAARAGGLDLLVDFTGSDWCAPCAKLEAEVFQAPEFAAAVPGRYVRVRLDFPRGPEALGRVPDPARNDELRLAHAVTGLPVVLLVDPDLADPDGTRGVYGRLGYLEGGPGPTLAAIESARERRDRVRAVLELGGSDARHAGEALLLLESDPLQPLGARLAPLVRPVALDGEREPALRVLRALAAAGLVDDECMERVIDLDPRNADGLYVEAVRSRLAAARDPEAVERAVAGAERLAKEVGGLEGEIASEAWSRAAGWSQEVLGDRVRTRWFATLALQAGGLPEGTRRRMEALAQGR